MFRLLVTAAVLGLCLSAADGLAAPRDPISRVHVVTGFVLDDPTAKGAVSFGGSGFAPATSIHVAVDGTRTETTMSSQAGQFVVRVRLEGGRSASLTAVGEEPGGDVRVVTAAVAAKVDTSAGKPGEISTRVYTNLLAGLAVVLLFVMGVVTVQAVRRRPTP